MLTIPRIGKRAFTGALVMGAIGVILAPGVAQAHFMLQSPPAWMSQDSLGLPEKWGPCGDEDDGFLDAAQPTNTVTAYQQGQTITVTITETIFHPGHYRIAIATDRSVLPPEPVVTAGITEGTTTTSACGNVPIQSAPYPVLTDGGATGFILADGVFTHTAPFTGPQSIQVTLPSSITCTKCTLQVIEFMGNHALETTPNANNTVSVMNGCFYHHCADLSLQSSQPGTGGAEAGSDAGPVGVASDASSPPLGTGTGTGTGSGGASNVGSDAGSLDTSDASGAAPDTTTKGSSSSGCSLTAGLATSGIGCVGGLGAVAMLVRRRRRRGRSL
jgi:hypothetical protein